MVNSTAELGARSCRPFAWRVPAFFHILFVFHVPACFFKAFFLRIKIRVPAFSRSKFCKAFQLCVLKKKICVLILNFFCVPDK